MNYFYAFLLIIIVSPFANASNKDGYYHNREEGWYWYEVEPEPLEDDEDPITTPQVATQPMTAKEIIAMQKERFDLALSNAVVFPTKENILAYLEIAQEINSQSQRFSESFKKAIWVTPEYDYSLNGRPHNTQALAAYNQASVEDKQFILREISSKKGIIYFFRSDCPYCKRFSPILKKFSENFGFTVIPVSLDGIGSEEYPFPKTSNYMADRLNVSVVPATFLVDPESNVVTTVGYGFNDWTALVDKVIYANEQTDSNNNIAIAGD